MQARASSLVILLHVDEEIAWQRKDDVPELRYFSRRKNEYYLIGHYLRIPIVNAEESIASVQGRVISLVDAMDKKNRRQVATKSPWQTSDIFEIATILRMLLECQIIPYWRNSHQNPKFRESHQESCERGQHNHLATNRYR